MRIGRAALNVERAVCERHQRARAAGLQRRFTFDAFEMSAQRQGDASTAKEREEEGRPALAVADLDCDDRSSRAVFERRVQRH